MKDKIFQLMLDWFTEHGYIQDTADNAWIVDGEYDLKALASHIEKELSSDAS